VDVIVFTVLLAAAVGSGFGIMFWKLLARRQGQDQDSNLDWFRSYSIDSYRPIQRLLDESDYRFLESQPGYSPAIARELRSERKKICRIYLRQLRGDFQSLVRLGKLMMVQAAADRADLGSALWHLTLAFYWNLALVHASLALPGFARGADRVTGLLGSMESMYEAVCGLDRQANFGLSS
jgi:hypothetical protein